MFMQYSKYCRLKKLIPKCWLSFSIQYTTRNIKIYENSFKVHPDFGKLFLKSHCNCKILPADYQLYPDSDHAKIVCWSTPGDVKPNVKAELLGKTNNLLKLEIFPSVDEADCEIHIPMKYDIEAEMEGNANLGMQNLESDRIDLTSAQGSITTKNIKTEELSILINDGIINIDGTFQGNLSLNAKKLTLKAKRLQGSLLVVQADRLLTEIESSYMTKGNVFANEGNLHIKNLHGSTDLYLSKGDLCINGLHGSIQSVVDEGNVYIQVSKVTNPTLIRLNKGSLHLSFSDSSDKSISVEAPLLEMSSDLEALGSKFIENERFKFVTTVQKPPVLHASVGEGTLKMFIKDWFSSLGIKTGS